MSYREIEGFYRQGNLSAARAALVEALKEKVLTVDEKKSVIRLNAHVLLEVYVDYLPAKPREWEVLEIINTGDKEIFCRLNVESLTKREQKALLCLQDVSLFEQHFRRYPKSVFCPAVNRFIISVAEKSAACRSFAFDYLDRVWLDTDTEEFLLSSNDLELICRYFGRYRQYAEMVERFM